MIQDCMGVHPTAVRTHAPVPTPASAHITRVITSRAVSHTRHNAHSAARGRLVIGHPACVARTHGRAARGLAGH